MQQILRFTRRIKVRCLVLDSTRSSASAISACRRLNLEQLVREHFGKEAVAIGFTTYDGTVTAASDWDGPAERNHVRSAHLDSYETLFHEVDVPNFFLNLRDANIASALRNECLERAIGVIYRPETELISHYFHARLPDQFDAILHL